MSLLSIKIDSDSDRVVSFAQIVLNTWSFARAVNISLGNVVFAPFKGMVLVLNFFYRLSVLFTAILTLVAIVPPFILLVSFVNILFFVKKKKVISDLRNLNRKDAIESHLKIEKSLRVLSSMRKSRVLFSLPLLGYLNNVFYNDVVLMESVLRETAYPNYGKIPSDIPIHKFDESDPWQDDLDQYSENEKLVLN